MNNEAVGGGEGEIHAEGIRHPEVQFDRSDLSTRGIYVFLLFLLIAGSFMHLAIWGVWRYLVRAEGQPFHPRTEVVAPAPAELRGDPAQRFPTPRLQPDPIHDLDAYRSQVEQRLNSYGWVDQKAGVVHIPIERAMDLVEQRGLPGPATPVNPPPKPGSPQAMKAQAR